MLSTNFIKHITRKAESSFTQAMLQNMNNILEHYEINTPLRIAHFLAQCTHESMDFSAKRENLNYSAQALLRVFRKYFTEQQAQQYARNPEAIANRVYANRLGNGPEESGDGWTYRGAGIFQLTGRSNYRKYGDYLNIDLENNPELACEPSISLEIACVYWDRNNLNKLADDNDIVNITYAINGGQHGIDDRINRFDYFYPLIDKEFN